MAIVTTRVSLPCDCRNGCPLCDGEGRNLYSPKGFAGLVTEAAEILTHRIADDDVELSRADAQAIADAIGTLVAIAEKLAPVEVCDHAVGLCSCGERNTAREIREARRRLGEVDVVKEPGRYGES